jgi:sugar phosphate isomerase/epimerase
MISRRHVLKSSLGIIALNYINIFNAFGSNSNSNRFQIGACDWSIGQHSNIEAMSVAKKIGLDGVQVSLGTVKNNMHLREIEIQKMYQEACKKNNVSIAGIAIGELNSVPYKSDPRTDKWVSDSIDVAHALGCKVVLLAFFGKGDLKGDPEGTKNVIKKLKKVAPKAEEKGIILGIESWLNAEEHMHIINAVGSPNVKVYYDVANSNKMGYNIYEEIRWLGHKNICEFHAKENGFLLGEGKVDFKEVRKAMDDINFNGWVMIEGAVPKNASMFESYLKNNTYLRGVLKS